MNGFFVHPETAEKYSLIVDLLKKHGFRVHIRSMMEKGRIIGVGKDEKEFLKRLQAIKPRED